MLLPLIRATDLDMSGDAAAGPVAIGLAARILVYAVLIAIGLGMGAFLGLVASLALGIVDLC